MDEIENKTIQANEYRVSPLQHPTRRERKKLATRNALQQAALELITLKGLHNVTIEDIAEAADVSNRTFFNYFPSKEEVLCANVYDLGDEIADYIASSTERLDSLTLLKNAILETLLETLTANSGIDKRQLLKSKMEIIYNEPQLFMAFAAAMVKMEKKVFFAMQERFTKNNPETPLDSDTAIYLASVVTGIFAVTRAMLMLWVMRNDTPPIEEMILRGIAQLENGFLTNKTFDQ